MIYIINLFVVFIGLGFNDRELTSMTPKVFIITDGKFIHFL